MKKKLLPVFIILIIFIKVNVSFSWDSTAAKYMPLQVGNVWVYYSESHSPYPNSNGKAFVKYRITGTIDTLGRKYFKFQETIFNISGIGGCPIPYLKYLSIDSATMNLILPNGHCLPQESILDSLSSKIYDTAKCVYANQFKLCIDTSTHDIFDRSFPSKKFTNDRYNSNTLYLLNIGLTRYGWGEAMNWCIDTLKGCVINGVLYGDTNTIVGINQLSSEVPQNFSLSQNYPNPFNPSTNIGFRIAESGLVRIIVYDALGKEVQTLVNQELASGTYEVDFNGSNLPSGVYYYILESGSFFESKKMILIK